MDRLTEGPCQCIKTLIKFGADPNVIPASVNVKIKNETTEIPHEPPLLVLARRYPQVNDQVLKVLLKHGANVDIQNENGDTFLHIIAQKPYHKSLKIIFNKSPNLNLQNKNGDTPLHILCKQSNLSVESCLNFIFFGSDINVSDKMGMKPLEYLSDEIVHELIKQVSNL